MQSDSSTNQPSGATSSTPAASGQPPTSQSASAGEQPPAADATTGAEPGTKGVEDSIRDAGHNLEAAAKDLGSKLDQKLASSETGREVKQKLGGFFKKIQETIK